MAAGRAGAAVVDRYGAKLDVAYASAVVVAKVGACIDMSERCFSSFSQPQPAEGYYTSLSGAESESMCQECRDDDGGSLAG